MLETKPQQFPNHKFSLTIAFYIHLTTYIYDFFSNIQINCSFYKISSSLRNERDFQFHPSRGLIYTAELLPLRTQSRKFSKSVAKNAFNLYRNNAELKQSRAQQNQIFLNNIESQGHVEGFQETKVGGKGSLKLLG